RQTGLQVAQFSDARESATNANAVIGRYTPEQALDLLLAHSGYQYRFINSHTIAIIEIPSLPTKSKTDEGPVPSPNGTKSTDRENSTMKRSGIFSRLTAFLFACGTVVGSHGACADDSPKTAGMLDEIV